MTSSYTSLLRFEQPVDGSRQSTWGQMMGLFFSLVENAIAGVTAISTTGGSTTLTTNDGAADQARKAILDVSGTLASNATIVIPNLTKTYLVRNATSGNFTLGIKTSSGSPITVPQGKLTLIYCDGADGVVALDVPRAFSALSDTPSSYSGQSGKLVRVKSTEDQLEFVAPTVQESEFASGQPLLFPAESPPTGWTQDTTVNDRMLRVTSGSGGGTGGSWTISGLTVGSTTLSISQMPSHDHDYTRTTTALKGNGTGANTIQPNAVTADDTSDTGGGASHNHSLSADGAWRPAYYNIIRATKD